MLVLSRKVGECITIGSDVTVMLTEIRGDKARIGVQAPENVPVHRQEVYDAMHAESPRHTDAMVDTVRDCRPNEDDMIGSPACDRFEAMKAQHTAANKEIQRLRNEVAAVRRRASDLVAVLKSLVSEPDYTWPEEMVRKIRQALAEYEAAERDEEHVG